MIFAQLFRDFVIVNFYYYHKEHSVRTASVDTFDLVGPGILQTNKYGRGQSGTYLRLTRASSGPWVSVAKTDR